MISNKKSLVKVLLAVAVIAGIAALVALSNNSPDKPAGSGNQKTAVSQAEAISVSDLIKSHGSYTNKEVAVQGYVLKHSAGYSIYESKEAKSGIPLDVPSNVDMKKHFGEGSGFSKTPLTVQGTYKQSGSKGLAIVVTNVK